eukprot:TRINITY_DN19603_c0_g1_i1.p1 TRINITY_DN19603_c0_g1~~TRINITY_DN19603_c0_g1_i1.p1  ORF type:complete len:344 (+),score=95.65 TRINITY_DN19603_c0_g1_i1:172-1203(+)
MCIRDRYQRRVRGDCPRAMATRVCIYGAGAIGGWIGAKLAQSGCCVSVVARGATLAALQQHGLRLREGDAVLSSEVRSSDDPAELGEQDIVVVAVKAPALAGVASAIGPLLGEDTMVVLAMNGVPWWFLHGLDTGDATGLRSVDRDGAISRGIAVKHVVGCVVHAGCSLDGPGQPCLRSSSGLVVGEPCGGSTPRTEHLATLLGTAGIATKVSARIQEDIWYKLLGNMTMNPISALTGATCDLIVDDDLVRGFAAKVMLEAKEVGAKLGVVISQTPEDRFAVTRKLGAFKSSMLQDHEAMRQVELDAILAAVRELAEVAGVETPSIDALFGLARLQAQVKGLY